MTSEQTPSVSPPTPTWTASENEMKVDQLGQKSRGELLAEEFNRSFGDTSPSSQQSKLDALRQNKPPDHDYPN